MVCERSPAGGRKPASAAALFPSKVVFRETVDGHTVCQPCDKGACRSIRFLQHALSVLTSQPRPDGKAAFEKAGGRAMSSWVVLTKKIPAASAGLQRKNHPAPSARGGSGDSPMGEEATKETQTHARQLLKKQWITFLGSDTHRTDHRPPVVASGLAYVYAHCTTEYADAISFGNAQRMLLKHKNLRYRVNYISGGAGGSFTRDTKTDAFCDAIRLECDDWYIVQNIEIIFCNKVYFTWDQDAYRRLETKYSAMV